MEQEDWDDFYDWLDDIADTQIDLNVRRDAILDHFEQLLRQLREGKDLSNKVIRLRNEDRLSVGVALHDGPIQELSAAMLLFQKEIEGSHHSRDPLVDSCRQFLRSVRLALEDIRLVILGSDPRLPQDLVSELRTVIREEGKDGLDIHLDICDELTSPGGIRPQMGEVIVLFVKETIRNAQNHGGADQLKIAVGKENDTVIVQTIDNGCGFKGSIPRNNADLQALADGGHLGLRILAELATPFKGHVVVYPEGSELGGAKVCLTVELG